jgi:hypothetical protein
MCIKQKLFKKGNDNRPEAVVVVEKVKTSWNLDRHQVLSKSLTKRFTFQKPKNPQMPSNRKETFFTENSTTEKNKFKNSKCQTLRSDSLVSEIRYSNQYLPGEENTWIFMHRQLNGSIVAQYQIKSCFI